MSRPGPGPGLEAGSAPGLPPQAPSQQPQGAQQTPPGYPHQPQFQQGFYPPYGQRFGPPPPFPPGPGFPNMPYGAPPGWFPPPGHGFPPGPGQFPPQVPIGPPGQQQPQQRPGVPGAAPAPRPTSELPVGDKVPSKPASRNATPTAQHAPTPPVESKPSVAEAVQASSGPTAAAQNSGRVVPAIPIAAPKPVAPVPSAPATSAQVNAPVTDATAAATAAVAAAMAKLPQPGAQRKPGQNDTSVEAVTRRMNEMRSYDNTRPSRGARGGRGGGRTQHKKIELPQSDYDFETANAKFNKQDLVKEAIATGSPVAEAEAHGVNGEADAHGDTAAHGTTASSTQNSYNRSTSFFDNISSEARDREENAANRLGGREWRGEEEKRNIETFGQGSVDGYRGRGRGRGHGRGRGYRGRGYNRGYGGRGGVRGGRAPSSQSTGVPSQG